MSNTLSREGHRQRLRDNYVKNGIDSLQPHNILELILTYAIPRRDVKEAAYNLLNYFDNDLNSVFSAETEELCRVDGIGESAAILIKLFNDIPERAGASRVRETVNDYVSSKEYARENFKNAKVEQLVLVCTDNSDAVICGEIIAQGSFSCGEIAPVKIVDTALRNNAASAFFVHITPASDYMPDEGDSALATLAYRALSAFGIRLKDYIIVGRNGTFSMCNDIRYMSCFGG